MPEQAVLETPSVVTTPVTTPVDTTQVVTPPAAPEVDLLTKVSQFKPPVEQDKITNPPEQPELASIADPIAKKAAQEAVERIRRGFHSDYTKKLEDAQRLVNQSQTWTKERLEQELNNPTFVAAAQLINSQKPQVQQTLTPEAYSALTDDEKKAVNLVPELQNELNQIKQSAANEQIRTAITQKDITYREKYSDYDSKQIDEACVNLGKLNLVDVREFVYKAINYEKNVKAGYEMGKLEGQGKLQNKINVIAPQGSTVVSNEGVPTKQKEESDKNFFIRLGEFRQAQFRGQK